jgi:molybdenum storage protein
MGESLVSKEFLRKTEPGEYFRMHPDINVLKIGVKASSTGEGGDLSHLDVLIRAKEKHKMILMTGGGTRTRHVLSIGVELGCPRGSFRSWRTRFRGRTRR